MDLYDSPEIAIGSVDTPENTGPSSSSGTVKDRRDLLNEKLKGYKGEEMKRKLPLAAFFSLAKSLIQAMVI